MFASNKVMPLPCLATKESQTSHDGPCQPFHHSIFISFMSCMYRQYHGNGTDDQNKCHDTHKCQRKVLMPGAGKSIKHHIRIGPKILAETDGAIRYQECAKRKCITHQKIPHHQFTILQVERAFTAAPPFGLMCCCCCRHNYIKIPKFKIPNPSEGNSLSYN